MYKNDPPGRSIFDCGVLAYDYANGVKMSFTQNVFHPRGMPSGGQNLLVYGTKGAVDLMYSTTMYPLERDAKPQVLAAKREQDGDNPHIVAFFESVLKGAPSPADITIGATAALTSIMGHEAMVKQAVVKWSDMGVNL
jgi:hypothetical protein